MSPTDEVSCCTLSLKGNYGEKCLFDGSIIIIIRASLVKTDYSPFINCFSEGLNNS